jgi:hypothetical protein
MIVEIKNLLERVLTEHSAPGLELNVVVRDAVGEKKAVNERQHPFASLITYPGTFDDTESGIRGIKKNGEVRKIYLRGFAKIPIIVRIWAKNEEDADSIVSAFVPYIPHRWIYNDVAAKVEIVRTEASDFASQMSGQYVAAVVVEFSCPMVI